MISTLNNYLQRRMQIENVEEVTLITAAQWLDEANILKNSSTSPGYSLRRHVHRGNIFGAYRKNNYFWYIKRLPNYADVIAINELAEILGLKNRTSLYRKIKTDDIPFVRQNRKGIYFKIPDLLLWAMERNRPDIFEKIQRHHSGYTITDSLGQV